MKNDGHRNVKPRLEEALELLEKSDYRLTRPRRLLLEAIFDCNGPFTVPALEKVLARGSKKEGCDAVTIYRTLPVFEKLGIIGPCDFSAEPVNYEVILSRKGHHHHFVCVSCDKVEPLEFCLVDTHESALKKRGYTQLTHRLEFKGKCPACSR